MQPVDSLASLLALASKLAKFIVMEMYFIYTSDCIKITFPLESTPYINIVHVHMLVSVHLLKSRKRSHFSSDCFAQ